MEVILISLLILANALMGSHSFDWLMNLRTAFLSGLIWFPEKVLNPNIYN